MWLSLLGVSDLFSNHSLLIVLGTAGGPPSNAALWAMRRNAARMALLSGISSNDLMTMLLLQELFS